MNKIREYIGADKETIVSLLNDLQSYLVINDPKKYLVNFSDQGNEYFDNLMQNIVENSGKIYVCETDGELVGLVAGYIEALDSADKLMSRLNKIGYVAELFVLEQYRGKGVARELMSEIEDFFKVSGCEAVSVTVDSFNQNAHAAYLRYGYEDRDILLMKAL